MGFRVLGLDYGGVLLLGWEGGFPCILAAGGLEGQGGLRLILWDDYRAEVPTEEKG